jgi:signal recognition particle receptor subunit beta
VPSATLEWNRICADLFCDSFVPLLSLAADHDGFYEARAVLHRLLAFEGLARACVLVYANKQDLPKAESAAELSETLALHSIRDHDWHIQACSALNGTGFYEGLDWVTARLKELNSA